jgi:hypothetical protein
MYVLQNHWKGRFLKMKNKWFVGFCVLWIFGLVLPGCASLNNLLNPVHAINSNGEKVEAAWGSGQMVKIEGVEYPYKDRPAVPAAPKKPLSPGNPPSKPEKPADPTGNITYYVSNQAITAYWKNAEELKQVLGKHLDKFSRENLQSQYDQYREELNQYNANLSTYQNRVATYQQNTAKYQQDLEKYNRDMAEYQARLPAYTAAVEAEAKTIQDSINPNAPSNWDRYVDSKYLLYKGK